jgi:hypothetical protein
MNGTVEKLAADAEAIYNSGLRDRLERSHLNVCDCRIPAPFAPCWRTVRWTS